MRTRISVWVFAAAFLFSMPAWAMQKHLGYATDNAGNVVSTASVRVKIAGSVSDATIYADDGVTPKVNPFDVESADGSYYFYAANGAYDITVTASGYTFDSDDTANVRLFDERDSLGVYTVKAYGATGDGVTDDGAELDAALDAAEVTCGTVYAPNGTYAYATSPNFARVCVNVVADRGTIFKHTGTGNAFIIDGGVGSGILGNNYKNITVQGNSNSTNGIYVRSIHHATFDHVRVLGSATTGAAIRVEWCVANVWNTPRVSSNEGALSPVPLYGMYLTRRASDSLFSTTQTITNPVMEGLTNTNGAGIYIDYGGGHKLLGGTSEANYNGLVISTNSYGLNLVDSMDMESNSNKDLILEGTSNTFVNILASSSNSIGATSNSNRNVFINGWITSLTIGANAFDNDFINVQFLTAFTDNSTAGNNFRHATLPGGIFVPDRSGDVLFADLGTPKNGSVTYCSDCAYNANPCTGSSTGAIAKRINGAWRCD